MDFLLGQYFKWLNMGNYDYKYRSKKQMILFGLEEGVFSTFEILGLHHVVCIVKNKTEALSLC